MDHCYSNEKRLYHLFQHSNIIPFREVSIFTLKSLKYCHKTFFNPYVCMQGPIKIDCNKIRTFSQINQLTFGKYNYINHKDIIARLDHKHVVLIKL
jgi:hypothetical protein